MAIAAANGEPLTPVQLQKTLFLLSQEKRGALGDDFYHFIAYDYGPFDQQIYRDAEDWAEQGAVSIQRPWRWAEYSATPDGVQLAAGFAKHAAPDAVDYLRRVVAWARNLSFQALLRAIYAKYPKYRENSVFRD